MKPMYANRQFLPVVIFSIALLSGSVVTNAQNHWNDKSNKNKERKEYRDEQTYRSDHSGERDSWSKGNKKQYKDKNWDRDNDNNKYRQHYSHKYNHSKNDYFNHPKYGRVYHRFDNKPIVFRHSHGNYYYSGNQFYTYHDGIGYCVAEPPRQVYFRDLPFRCSRIYANGHEYYRHGDLFFHLSSRGYVIVPSPFEVNFSVRF